MAITKAQASSLSNDLLMRGVIDTIVKECAILSFLPFMEVTGTSISYNREATMPEASFYNVGDTWTEATPTFTKHTAQLAIIGGDADVDNFLQQTYSRRQRHRGRGDRQPREGGRAQVQRHVRERRYVDRSIQLQRHPQADPGRPDLSMGTNGGA